jgi:hypothetical protein
MATSIFGRVLEAFVDSLGQNPSVSHLVSTAFPLSPQADREAADKNKR